MALYTHHNSLLILWVLGKNYSHCRYPLQFHDQAIVEHINHVIKEFLSQLISPEAKWDPNLVLLEVLFHISFLSFDKVGLSPAYKQQAYLPRDISLPLLRWNLSTFNGNSNSTSVSRARVSLGDWSDTLLWYLKKFKYHPMQTII